MKLVADFFDGFMCLEQFPTGPQIPFMLNKIVDGGVHRLREQPGQLSRAYVTRNCDFLNSGIFEFMLMNIENGFLHNLL